MARKFTRAQIAAAVEQHGTQAAAAEALGCTDRTIRAYLNSVEDYDAPPDKDRSVAELLEHKRRSTERQRKHHTAAALITRRVRETAPIGIVHFGDPHVDDEGCDFVQLEHDISVVQRTPGMLGASVGDYSNNWVGRLARLYAAQTVTALESWKLVEWFVGAVEWLYLIGGNHDAWAGNNDPLLWFQRQYNLPLKYHGARVAIEFPNKRRVIVNARHDFKGTSQYHNTHGPLKAAQFGYHDDIFSCGHKHDSGYMRFYHRTGDISHIFRSAGYKRWDEYAAQLGYENDNRVPSYVTIIDPAQSDRRNLITVYDSVDYAAEVLTWLRGKSA